MPSGEKNKKLNAIARRVLRYLGEESAKADIHLVTPAKIKELNRKFRDKDKETNVLAFPYPETFPHLPGVEKYLGEVYLCESYIKKRGEDINFMLVHGILHLLGFNHIKKGDRIVMERLEKEVMDSLGLSNH